MTWVKRNLVLVIGGVIALGLLGYAGYFLFTNKQRVDEITVDLTAQRDEYKSLMTRDPHPNQDNIEKAKHEQARLAEILGQLRRYFVPVAAFGTNFDSAAFKGLLETSISEMERDADRAGVALPAKYGFTFSAQRTRVDFAKETIAPLAMQVAEIKAMCDLLFRARVHSLISLRRSPVAKEDEGATDYLVGKKATTNAVTGAVLSPYEITFQGFSAELAGVLDGFLRSTNCFIVKNVDVQTNVVAAAGPDVTLSPYFNPYAQPGSAAPQPAMTPEQMMRARYGLPNDPMSRYRRPGGPLGPPVAPTPTPTPAPAPAFRRGPETVLDERPLKVTLYVEAVRLVEPAAEPQRPAGRK
jgi:hypothetical protein